MPSADSLNIEIQQHGTFTMVVTLSDDAGDPIDLTGYSIAMQVRASASASETLFDLSTTGGEIVLTTPASGVFTVTITDETTGAETAPVDGVYDVVVEDASGTKTRIMEGRALFTAGVTR